MPVPAEVTPDEEEIAECEMDIDDSPPAVEPDGGTTEEVKVGVSAPKEEATSVVVAEPDQTTTEAESSADSEAPNLYEGMDEAAINAVAMPESTSKDVPPPPPPTPPTSGATPTTATEGQTAPGSTAAAAYYKAATTQSSAYNYSQQQQQQQVYNYAYAQNYNQYAQAAYMQQAAAAATYGAYGMQPTAQYYQYGTTYGSYPSTATPYYGYQASLREKRLYTCIYT